jgi:hypothetical protein
MRVCRFCLGLTVVASVAAAGAPSASASTAAPSQRVAGPDSSVSFSALMSRAAGQDPARPPRCVRPDRRNRRYAFPRACPSGR